MTQFNLNPHYQIPLNNSINLGFGPSFGLANVKIGNQDDTVFTYGVGTSLNADLTPKVFIGAEARYEATTDAKFSEVEDDLNNVKVFVKLGYKF